MGFFAKGKKGFPSASRNKTTSTTTSASETGESLTPRMGILQMADHISESESNSTTSSAGAAEESGSIPSLKISNSWTKKQKNHFFLHHHHHHHGSTSRCANKTHATHKFQRLPLDLQSPPPTLKDLNLTVTAEQGRFPSLPIAHPLPSCPSPLSIPEAASAAIQLQHKQPDVNDQAGDSSSVEENCYIKEKAARSKFFSKRKKTSKHIIKKMKFVALDESSIYSTRDAASSSDDAYEPPQGFPPEFPSDDYADNDDDEDELEVSRPPRQSLPVVKKHAVMKKKRAGLDAGTFQPLEDEVSTHEPSGVGKKKHSTIKKKREGLVAGGTFQPLEDEVSTNEQPGFGQDYEPPVFSLQSKLIPSDSNDAGYETLTSLEYSGPHSSSDVGAGTSHDSNQTLPLSIEHSFSDPGFDVRDDEVVQASSHAMANAVLLNRSNENTPDKFSETGSAEFSQFVFDHAFTRIKSVAVEKSDAGGSDGLLSAAVALTAVLSPPHPSALPARHQPQLQLQATTTASRQVSTLELEAKAQPKKFVIKMTPSKKKDTPRKARNEMPVLREAKGFENLMRKDPTRDTMPLPNTQATTSHVKNLVEDYVSLPGGSVVGPSVSGSPSSSNENHCPRASTTENIFLSSSEATIVSSESSANMEVAAKTTKKLDANSLRLETKQESNVGVVDEMDDDPFRAGTQADDALWETGDNLFHVVSRTAKQKSQLRQHGNRVTSDLVEKDPLIICIRQACKRDARDGVKKPDPSPRGVQLASSSTSDERNTADSTLLRPDDAPKAPHPVHQTFSESDNTTGSKTFNTYISSSVDITEPSGPKISSPAASTSSCETKDSSHDSSGYIMNPINNDMWGKYAAGEFYKPPDSIIMNAAPPKTSKAITTKTSNHTLDISALSMLSTGESEADSDEAVLHGTSYNENPNPGPIKSSTSLTPSGIPSNAIMGSMLFRHTHSESTVTLNGSRDKKHGDDKGDDVDDDDDDDRSMQVPPSVKAIRTTESNVSSVTEEASSFYKSKFQNSCWNKQAHDVLNNYHRSRTTSKTQNSNHSARVQQQLIQAADQGHKYYI